LKVGFVGDQSIFVAAAIAGVGRKGVIAAVLTSIMILCFWAAGDRQSSLRFPSRFRVWLGRYAVGDRRTLNIMTLGGLALAVGILVDEATVTIENINWHLEHARKSDRDPGRRQQIVVPAFVSLLCICIVFVPMFFLQGVPPLPVRRRCGSGDIRDDLVVHPVADAGADHAMYLLQPHLHHAEERPPPRSRNPLVRFRAASRRLRAIFRGGYRDC